MTSLDIIYSDIEPIERRIQCLLDIKDTKILDEIISSLLLKYSYTQTEIASDFIYYVTINNIPAELRYKCFELLKSDNHPKIKEITSYLILDLTNSNLLNYNLEVDVCLFYIEQLTQEDELLLEYIQYLTLYKKIETLNRYSKWIDIKKKLESRSISLSIERDIYSYFLSCDNSKCRLFSCQYFFRVDTKPKEDVIETCLHLIKSDDDKLKSSAADLLIHERDKVDEKYVNEAKGTIRQLGYGKKVIKTVYTDSQNSHIKEFDIHIQKFLRDISTIEHKTKLSDFLEDIKGLVQSDVEVRFDDDDDFSLTKEQFAIIELVIARIKLDESNYGGELNLRLETIFCKAYEKIKTSLDKVLLIRRLCEELIESHNECSSGHLNRIINTFSAISINLSIGFERQIEGCIVGRFQAYCKKDTEFGDLVLSDLTNTELFKKKSFIKLFHTLIPKIRDELYGEYVSVGKLLTDNLFDEYFKKGVQTNFPI